jgi:hypothetical protein
VSIFFIDEKWKRDAKKGETAKNCTNIYTDISYHGKLKEPTLRVTEYRYPPFDRGERTSKTKVTQKETQKQYEKKNQSLYTGSPNSIESFSTEKLSK